MTELSDLAKAIDEKGEAVDALQKALKLQDEELKSMGGTTAETKQALAKANEAISKWNESKTSLEERLGLIETAMQRGATGGKDDSGVPEAVTTYQTALNEQFIRKCDDSGLREMLQKALDASPELKAMAVNSEPDGGFLVTPDQSGRMASVIRETSMMRQVAAVQPISTDALEGPVDEGRAPFGWVAETESRPGTGTPQVGTWRIPTHECYAEPAATQKFLEDANVDAEGWLINKLGETFALGEEEAFVLGDGIVQPRGIITYTPEYTDPDIVDRKKVRTVRTGTAGDLTSPNPLVNCVYRLKAQYRRGASWALSREGQEKARLLKQDDKYVWQPGLQAGQPDRLLGYSINEFNDLPDFADGAIVGIFADFPRTYQIVDRVSMSILRDPYTAKPFVKFYARRRVGGDVLVFDSMVYLEASANP